MKLKLSKNPILYATFLGSKNDKYGAGLDQNGKMKFEPIFIFKKIAH
jgi:hypothetical protein